MPRAAQGLCSCLGAQRSAVSHSTSRPSPSPAVCWASPDCCPPPCSCAAAASAWHERQCGAGTDHRPRTHSHECAYERTRRAAATLRRRAGGCPTFNIQHCAHEENTNIEHSTSNAEHPTQERSGYREALLLFSSAFDVRCSMFDVRVFDPSQTIGYDSSPRVGPCLQTRVSVGIGLQKNQPWPTNNSLGEFLRMA